MSCDPAKEEIAARQEPQDPSRAGEILRKCEMENCVYEWWVVGVAGLMRVTSRADHKAIGCHVTRRRRRLRRDKNLRILPGRVKFSENAKWRIVSTSGGL